jgi:hypothetical protein
MSKPITVPNTFAAQSGPIALSQLDVNFSTIVSSINDTATYSNYYADTGAVNTMQVTLPVGQTLFYTAGVQLLVKVGNTNTSTAVTLNVNVNGSYIGAQSVLMANGVVPPIGQLVIGQILNLVYDGTAWRVLSGQGIASPLITTGTFTGTLTDCTTAPTFTCYYIKIGNFVNLTAVGASATSNTTSFSFTGLPALLQPVTQNVFVPCVNCSDNSVAAYNVMAVFSIGSGTVALLRNQSFFGWTASGVKGFVANSFNYSAA